MKQQGRQGTVVNKPSHIQRALINLFGMPKGAPEITYVELPLRSGKQLHPVFLPSKFFSALYHNNKEKWLSCVQGAPGAIEVYWASMVTSKFFKKHPCLTPSTCGQAVPLGFHGDAGSFSHQDSLYTFSWNSLLASPGTTTRDGRFLFTVIKTSGMVEETLAQLLTVFCLGHELLAIGLLRRP